MKWAKTCLSDEVLPEDDDDDDEAEEVVEATEEAIEAADEITSLSPPTEVYAEEDAVDAAA
jgi:hypothetical protein